MQRLTVYSHPLRIIWQEPPIGRLLQGATPVYAKTLISRLFTLCAQAHSAAAALLLFPEEEPDMQAAQQELARETLRRALTDWLPYLATDRQPLKNGRCYVAETYPRWRAQSFSTMILISGLPLAYRAGKHGFCKSVLKPPAGWRHYRILLHLHYRWRRPRTIR